MISISMLLTPVFIIWEALYPDVFPKATELNYLTLILLILQTKYFIAGYGSA